MGVPQFGRFTCPAPPPPNCALYLKAGCLVVNSSPIVIIMIICAIKTYLKEGSCLQMLAC